MRVHWDDTFAQSVGAARAYDYGMLRNAWIEILGPSDGSTDSRPSE